MTELIETRRKRLLYKANYRGFREADLLIGGFAKAHLAGMGEAELDEFEALLKLNDRDLFDWATGKREAPANMAGPVFDRLCKFDIAGVIHGAAQD
ncbi:MAG: succinate dehydrogenase assembly factor 2 [Pseudomonadota bacterium]